MQIKKKLCVGCKNEQYIWKSNGKYKYCKRCWLAKVPTKPLKQTFIKPTNKPIRNKSSKMSAQLTIYTKMRKTFLEKYSMCQAHLNKCTLQSTDIHHMKGRGKYLNDPTTWLSVCRVCHNWIEKNPTEAQEMGFSEIRN